MSTSPFPRIPSPGDDHVVGNIKWVFDSNGKWERVPPSHSADLPIEIGQDTLSSGETSFDYDYSFTIKKLPGLEFP